MTTIHLNTETGHRAAFTLRDQAALALQLAETLRRALRNLEFAWQGGAQTEFILGGDALTARLQEHLTALQILADRLEREVTEWEEADQRGAATFRGTATLPLGAISSAAGQAAFTTAAVSVASLLTGLPVWLISLLDRFFPPSEIVPPLADESVAPAHNQTATDAKARSKFGELLEKAEKEKQVLEEKQPAAVLKPAHLSDYPARDDDGSYLAGQEKDDSCSIASTRMALKQALDVDASESDLRTASSELDGGYENNANKWGTNPSTLDDLVNAQYPDVADASYDNPGSQSVVDLQQAVSEGKGIVVSVKNTEWFGSPAAHSVTVVGVETQHGQQVVLINDPWPPGVGKRLAIPADDFERAWYGDAMYVTKKI